MVSIRFAVRESHALLQSAMSPAPTSTAGLAAAAPAASGPGEGGPDGSSTQVASARTTQTGERQDDGRPSELEYASFQEATQRSCRGGHQRPGGPCETGPCSRRRWRAGPGPPPGLVLQAGSAARTQML